MEQIVQGGLSMGATYMAKDHVNKVLHFDSSLYTMPKKSLAP